jgi:hypothetical protein
MRQSRNAASVIRPRVHRAPVSRVAGEHDARQRRLGRGEVGEVAALDGHVDPAQPGDPAAARVDVGDPRLDEAVLLERAQLARLVVEPRRQRRPHRFTPTASMCALEPSSVGSLSTRRIARRRAPRRSASSSHSSTVVSHPPTPSTASRPESSKPASRTSRARSSGR